MKKLLLLCILLGFTYTCYAQSAPLAPPTQVVKKSAGETTVFAFDYAVADEALITHFSLRWVDDLTKTATELKTIPKNLRGTSISAAFTPGLKFTYYVVVAIDATVPTAVIESGPSNTVAIQRVGPPPTNNRITQ